MGDTSEGATTQMDTDLSKRHCFCYTFQSNTLIACSQIRKLINQIPSV